MSIFRRKGQQTNKNIQSPGGAQTDLEDPFSANPIPIGYSDTDPYVMRPEMPFGHMPHYNRNWGLRDFRTFHYGEDNLPGRLYPTYTPPWSFVASDVIMPGRPR